MSLFAAGFAPAAAPDPFTVVPSVAGETGRAPGTVPRDSFAALLSGEIARPTAGLDEESGGTGEGEAFTNEMGALLAGALNGRLGALVVDARSLVATDGAGSAATADADLTQRLAPDPGKLHPELLARLQRVMERMKAEGFDVEIAEGFRTPERQAALFAQGRTAPGPVVTWTRDSQHTQGLAADVVINGGYEDAGAYLRFAQLAREEGLKSLAPLDPGHVELEGTALPGGSLGSSVTITGVMADVARPARVARVASVADVAQLASVARVAKVAQPGVQRAQEVAAPAARVASLDTKGLQTALAAQANPAAPTTGDASATTQPGPSTADGALAVEASSTRGRQSGSDAEGGGQNADAQTPQNQGLSAFRAEGLGKVSEPTLETPNFPRIELQPRGLEATERAERVREVLAQAARRPVQQLSLAVDAGTSDEAVLNIRLRDGRVSTSIGVRDPFAAERIHAEAASLRASLMRQGLEAEAVNVRTLVPGLDPAEVLRRETVRTFVPGLGEPLSGQTGDQAGPGTRSRGFWDSLNRERQQGGGRQGGQS